MQFILRAHHILCIQGFRGKGYSEEFVSNMKVIIDYLENNENKKIKIINNPDHICLSCPNNVGQSEMRRFEINNTYEDKGFCENERYIVNLDNMVIKALDIELESHHTYKSLLEKIKKNMTIEKFENICGDCQWYSLGYCREGILCKENIV